MICKQCGFEKFGDKPDKNGWCLKCHVENKEWHCRVSPTLGDLEGTHDKVWGTLPYEQKGDNKKITWDEAPTVFMGIYGLPDFYTLWRHKGRKAILWCGTDITHLINGYWLDTVGKIRVNPSAFADWINENCENYCENKVEQAKLAWLHIKAKVVPSFLGNVDDFKPSFKSGNKLYTSVSGNDYKTYGWDKIPYYARTNPNIEFHLYGNTGEKLKGKNIFDHGRVPKEQMNSEIKYMQGCLRLTEFDGFSEIVAKALLMEQYPVSLIEYPYTFNPQDMQQIVLKRVANREGRQWLLRKVNRFPWNRNLAHRIQS